MQENAVGPYDDELTSGRRCSDYTGNTDNLNFDCGECTVADIVLSLGAEHGTNNKIKCWHFDHSQSRSSNSIMCLLLLTLLRCGDDVHPWPGPSTPKIPYTVCDKGITARSEAIDCDRCEGWTHVILIIDYDLL